MTIDELLQSPETAQLIDDLLPQKITNALEGLEYFPSRQQIKSLEMHRGLKGISDVTRYAKKQNQRASLANRNTEAEFWLKFLELFDPGRNSYLRGELQIRMSEAGLLSGTNRENRAAIRQCVDRLAKHFVSQFCAHCDYRRKLGELV